MNIFKKIKFLPKVGGKVTYGGMYLMIHGIAIEFYLISLLSFIERKADIPLFVIICGIVILISMIINFFLFTLNKMPFWCHFFSFTVVVPYSRLKDARDLIDDLGIKPNRHFVCTFLPNKHSEFNIVTLFFVTADDALKVKMAL